MFFKKTEGKCDKEDNFAKLKIKVPSLQLSTV